jgi:hypothetical protein
MRNMLTKSKYILNNNRILDERFKIQLKLKFNEEEQ